VSPVVGSFFGPERTWTHDYPVTYQELSGMGLPVSTDMPPDVYEFMELFPQPKQKRLLF